jgi:hypothetical protein
MCYSLLNFDGNRPLAVPGPAAETAFILCEQQIPESKFSVASYLLVQVILGERP